MIKKIGSVIVSLSVIGITTLGVALSEHGDVPVPQRPDLAYSHGNTGGIISNENEHGDVPAPAYNKGDTPVPKA